MHNKTLLKKNLYYDSITLMGMSAELSALPGVADVLAGMATQMNKQLLGDMGLMTEEAQRADANDMIIGIRADDEKSLESALLELEKIISGQEDKASAGGAQRSFETIRQVSALDEGYNLAVISVPGAYAAHESKAALKSGMHVFLFSDNVTIEEELELKTLACEKGLLLMGPDCGTAIIGGVPLGFANKVRNRRDGGLGNIGIAAASGTGLQHVTTLIDHMGCGISQAVGTGGRDLSVTISAKTMLAALDALDTDSGTDVVVILSKPPAPSVADIVISRAKKMTKPVVMCLFGADEMPERGSIIQTFDIEQTAVRAVSIATGREAEFTDRYVTAGLAGKLISSKKPGQKYVRGIFCGGTLCDEAMITFRRRGIALRSNIPITPGEKLDDVNISAGNTFIDMGDDYFTLGKPHPMIEPSLRNGRIIADARLPDTAAMLIDVVLGYGSHEDPAGLAVQAKNSAGREDIAWIASVVGTGGDRQGYSSQVQKLIDAGFAVFESNVRAAGLAAEIAGS